ncbi:lipopolysaccharide biosynthesis protein [Geomonas anaerohicana]|nr:oligosaccharide flippase family protein [Geomonas anaerohicana]
MGGSLFAQILTVATMPLVTRLFTPEDIGSLSVFVTFYTMASACACMRFDGALMVPEDLGEVDRLVALSIWSTITVSFLSGLLLALLSYKKLFGLGVLSPWAGCFAVAVVCGLGLTAVFRALRLRGGEFSVLATIGAMRNSANIVVRLAGGSFGWGIPALLAAELVAAWAAIRRLGGRQLRSSLQLACTSSMADLIKTARRWRRFPLYEIPSQVLDQIAAAIPLLIVADRLGSGAAGLYAVATRFSTLPNTHIGAAVGDVFRSRFAEYVRAGERRAAKRLYQRLMARTAGLALVVLVPMLWLVPQLFGFVFGQAWLRAGMLVPWIAAWGASCLVVSPLSPLLQILQRQNLKWIYDGSVILATAIAVIAASGTDLETHVRLLSVAGIAGNVVYFIVLDTAVRRI